jgi:PHS family inorganic phosphate transporter-like MFS transporter
MNNNNEPDGVSDLLSSINDTEVKGFHYKTWLIAGMGFFTDAYDLFIIGAVLSLLPLAGWTALSVGAKSLIASTALLSAVIGAVIFGRLLDMLGRKAIYGIELVLLIAGALGSAFLTPVNGVLTLIAWRFLLGVGIGGDYATSSIIMSEYSNTKKRGMLVGMVFSMQSLGLVVGPAITLVLISSGMAPSIIWKLMLAFGAIPALFVIYGRRKLPETPKYSLNVKGDAKTASKNWEKISGVKIDEPTNVKPTKIKWSRLFTDRAFLITLIGTAGTWFLMDWALYGNSIMSNQMLAGLVPSTVTGIAALKATSFYTLLVFGIAAFPGYWIATFTIDRIGRKPIQLVGFMAMAATFATLGIFSYLLSPSFIAEFLIIYGLSYFFIEFGPNVTTFIYPPEVFPTALRGLGTGASAAGGKTGAFIGTALNVIITAALGESSLFLILALLSAMGFALTFFALPEPKGKVLEDISGETRYAVNN